MRKKQIHPHPLCHGHTMHSLKVTCPKNGRKSAIAFIAKNDQHEILFPPTPDLTPGFVSKSFSPMTSWLRHLQLPAKDVHGDFQIWIFSRKNPKTEFRVKQIVRWLDHIPC